MRVEQPSREWRRNHGRLLRRAAAGGQLSAVAFMKNKNAITTMSTSTTLLEITGKYIRERHRFENDGSADVIIADVDIIDADASVIDMDTTNTNHTSKISIKGEAEYGELIAGIKYRFYGRWRTYKNKRTGQSEKQFSFNSFVGLAPAGREAITAYLRSHGAGHGLGKVRAERLWELFGEDAVRVARTDPEQTAKALSSIGLRYSRGDATGLATSLLADFAIEAIKLDLTGLLANRSFPKSIVNTVIQTWGNRAALIVRRDPYRLLKFSGCGFSRCDSMYLDLGLNPTKLKRQALCAWYSISRDSDGHTWHSWKVPDAYLRTNISGAGVKIDRALSLAVRGRVLSRVDTRGNAGPISSSGDVAWYAETTKADNERTIADAILRARHEKPFWPEVNGLQRTTDHQSEVLASALGGTICMLGGSPGTGKTWLLSELVISLAEHIGLANIVIGCPTGKAAVRVTENLTAKGVDLRARTWHSILMQMEKKGEKHFAQKVIIGDESSMVDTDLMAAIMRAKPAGSMLLLVGDVNQLPPVGHGAPLRDMIAAGLPYGELTQIMRNSGGIVEACAAIRDQRRWATGDNLQLIETADNHLERINQVIQMALADGVDPVWGVQIVTAVNEKSPLSRVELNRYLQRVLNTQPGEEGVLFRRGDKVVNTKNAFFKEVGFTSTLVDHRDAGDSDRDNDNDSDRDQPEQNERDEVFVANGELAKVISVDRTSMICDLDSPARRIQVWFGGEGGCTFELGYALSVHKSQGSDWPWVVVVLDGYPGARMVCDRAWLYTSISRAKDKCWLIGQRNVADRMCRVSKIWQRKTFLRELVLAGRAVDLVSGV